MEAKFDGLSEARLFFRQTYGFTACPKCRRKYDEFMLVCHQCLFTNIPEDPNEELPPPARPGQAVVDSCAPEWPIQADEVGAAQGACASVG